MSVKKVKTTKYDGYQEIILDDADHLNVLSKALISELNQCLADAESDDSIKCILLRANGRAFSAGANLKEFDELSEKIIPNSEDDPIKNWQKLDSCKKPVIASVQGFALGGGFEILQMCDLIIAAESASFGQPEVLLNTIPGGGGTQRLSRNITYTQAFEMMVFGERISAEMAQMLGIINWVVPDEQLEVEAKNIVEKVAEKPLHVLESIKSLIRLQSSKDLPKNLSLERKKFFETFAHQELHSALEKFTKR